MSYADDFQTQKHLHLALIDNLDHLEWTRGYVGAHGVKGRRNVVTLKQKFVSDVPIAKLRLRVASSAHRALGSHNVFGLSLDGREPVLSESTKGKERKDGRYRDTIEIDSGGESRFTNVREFWVHLSMINGTAKDTRTSNRITSYEIEAPAPQKGVR